ncbi:MULTISPECIES: DUF2520 domain-containing protein [Allobranchiibius]|uniref:Putative short-subunit dehydrogenase-like oxidoreductase (DUF2520 family) n=1 Tax=Allobranchiibius huperziae TaxID=1874116 RepID=A0A853DGZ5_9MICO|nr:DUF2520 domain-containing protein [Allobranchiibius sp. GilTou38]NYJ73475.1 putative short-subunit dehydrogenase-like oxidoreductase (DUF2520 family) [Allobranchiibius huperziae]
MSTTGRPPSLRVAVVGCGRVGAVLGAAFRAAGHEVTATSAVSDASLQRAAEMLPGVPVLPPPEVARSAEVVLLTVPDDELGDLTRSLGAQGAWNGGRLVIHTSGFHGCDVLAPVVEAGGDAIAMHPAMTFTGTARDLPRLLGIPMAVTASMGADLIAEALVLDLGGEPLPLSEEQRPRYHAALTHGANHLVTLVAQSQQILRHAGIEAPQQVLDGLLTAALTNALEHGDRALTGPVARGDVETVRAHLQVLSDESPDVPDSYRAMALATALRAAERHATPARTTRPMLDLLDPNGQEG